MGVMMPKPFSCGRALWVSIPLVTISVLLIFLTPVSGQAPSAKEGEAPALPPPANVTVDFERDVAPIFATKCEACHGSSQQMSGLRLDNRAAALKGGYTGAAIELGKSGQSRLIQMLVGVPGRPLMPMGGEKLTDKQIGLLRAWIDQGAVWPELASDDEPEPEAVPERAEEENASDEDTGDEGSDKGDEETKPQ